MKQILKVAASIVCILASCFVARTQLFRLGDTEHHFGWYKLGRLTLPQGGANAVIHIHAGVGYNALHVQMASTTLHFRSSNAV